MADAPTFSHEPWDGYQLPDGMEHDTSVDQYHCVACHWVMHNAYHEEINEIEGGLVVRDEGHPVIAPNDPYDARTRGLTLWHAVNEHCPFHVEGGQ